MYINRFAEIITIGKKKIEVQMAPGYYAMMATMKREKNKTL